jgi:thioredoxin 1
VVEQVAKELAGKVKIVGADVGETADTASSLGIMSIPALVFFKGGKEVHRIVGGIKKEQLVAEIKKNLGV